MKKFLPVIFILALIITGCPGNKQAGKVSGSAVVVLMNAEELEQALARGEYSRVLVECRKILAQNPGDAKVKLIMCRALMNIDSREAALRELGNLDTKEARLFRLHILVDLERKKEALALLAKMRNKGEVPSDIDFLEGRLYLQAGDMKSAENAFRRAIESDPSNLDAFLFLSQVYLSRMDKKGAIAVLDKVDASRLSGKEKVGLLLRKGNLLRELAANSGDDKDYSVKFRKSTECFKEAFRLDPANRDAEMGIALNYIEMRDYNNTQAAIKEILRKNPDDFAAHMAMGRFLMEGPNIPRGYRELMKAMEKEPHNPAPYYLAGNFSTLHKEYAQADRILMEGVKNTGNPSMFYPVLEFNMMAWGKEKEAGEYYKKMTNLSTGELALFYATRGDTYLYHYGDLEKAKEWYSKAIRISRGGFADSSTRLGLGLYYLLKDEDKQAEAEFEKAIKDRKAQSIYYILNAVNFLVETGRADWANRYIERWEKMSKGWDSLALAGGYTSFGVQYYIEGDYKNAEKWAKKAVPLDTGKINPELQSLLGDLARVRGEAGKADEYYKVALKRDPESENANLGLALLALKAGESEKAQNYFNAATDTGYILPPAHYEYARFLAAAGREMDALPYLYNALNNSPRYNKVVMEEPAFKKLRQTPEFEEILPPRMKSRVSKKPGE
ncbi:MAG: tetratricopeptide repeat protein [Chloroflexi bacterium]|nr:tetratricopeptide repeat protein [Chloroflexota bacterium]